VAFRTTSFAIGFFQNLTTGGVLYGWTAISGSFLLAKPTDGGIGLSHDYILVMFIIATFFSSIGPLLLGMILDSWGPRICSAFSMFLAMLGCVLFAISNLPNFPMFMPALSLIAFSGPGVQNSLVHLINLFPLSKRTATTLFEGSYHFSFCVFYLFDRIWYYLSFNYQSIFVFYATVCLMNLAVSLLIWPNKPYAYKTREPLNTAYTVQQIPRVGAQYGQTVSQDNTTLLYLYFYFSFFTSLSLSFTISFSISSSICFSTFLSTFSYFSLPAFLFYTSSSQYLIIVLVLAKCSTGCQNNGHDSISV
jgi:MFS family permease